MLADTAEIYVVGEASDAQELMARIGDHPCEVMLVDSTLPGQQGLEILGICKRIYPELRVLVCSTYVGSLMEAFKAGAAGFLAKDGLPEELVHAIRQVMQGKRYVSPSQAEHVDWCDIPEN